MEKKIKLFVLIISIAISLLAGEVFLRFYFDRYQDYDIEMWRYAVELKQPVDDNRSHIHISESKEVLMGAPVIINSKGLRDKEYDYEKPEDVYRILVIGDSLTFGWGVKSEETFSKILEDRLNDQNNISQKYKKIEVINSGIGNYNTKQELAFLENEGLRYSPDEVILAYFINDAENTQKETNNFLTRRSILYTYIKSVKNRISFVVDGEKRYNVYYSNLYNGDNFTKYKGILESLDNRLRENNIRLTVVILPEFHDFNNYEFDNIHDKITDFFSEKERFVIDPLYIFKGQDSRSFWVARDDPHPNAMAHKLISNVIFEKIKVNF